MLLEPTLCNLATNASHVQGAAPYLPRLSVIINRVENLEYPIRNLICSFGYYTLLITPFILDGLPANTTQILANTMDWMQRLRYERKVFPKLVVIFYAEHIFVNLNYYLYSHILSLLYQLSERVIVTIRYELVAHFRVFSSFNRIFVTEDKYVIVVYLELFEYRVPQPRLVFSRFWELLGIY